MAKAPVQPRQHRRDRVLRRGAALDLARDEVADDFGVGLALERAPFGDQLVAQRLEILDDAVVDQRDRPDDVRMGVADRRRAMRRPARVRDAGGRRASGSASSSRARLSSLPSARRRSSSPSSMVQMPAEVIAAIFEPLEPIEQALRDVATCRQFRQFRT